MATQWGNIEQLNSYIIEGSDARSLLDITHTPTIETQEAQVTYTNELIQTEYNTLQTIQQLEEHPILDEELIDEVEMIDRMEALHLEQQDLEAERTKEHIEQIIEDHIISTTLGDDITNISEYETRNRKYNPNNPFFITHNTEYKLGALADNTPGEQKKEQLLFISNILRLPKNTKLIKDCFWEGNN